MSTTALDVRQHFPSLASGFAYLENAGGSQVPASVIRKVTEYFENSYVQLGAGYPASITATETVAKAHTFVNRLMNGEAVGKTVLGSSTTSLLCMLSNCYQKVLKPGDEVIVGECGHEGNITPWLPLQDAGIVIRWWKPASAEDGLPISGLKQLLSEKTRIVAFPQVSNLLGQVYDVEAITKLAHEAGAKVVVDGVAYAAHAPVDVEKWGCDWYVYSCYKVYGPHMAALFGREDAFEPLTGPNHFFLPDTVPYKFQIGGANHEGCAGLLGTLEYLNLLGGASPEAEADTTTIHRAFKQMRSMEIPVQAALLDFLRDHPAYAVVGHGESTSDRVPTVGFRHRTMKPVDVVAQVDKKGIGIRWGHMYSYRLCEALGIPTDEGVVRASAVHYNTVEEVQRLCQVLEEIG